MSQTEDRLLYFVFGVIAGMGLTLFIRFAVLNF
jgi:hypothetical protein